VWHNSYPGALVSPTLRKKEEPIYRLKLTAGCTKLATGVVGTQNSFQARVRNPHSRTAGGGGGRKSTGPPRTPILNPNFAGNSSGSFPRPLKIIKKI